MTKITTCRYCRNELEKDSAFIHIHVTPKTKTKWYFCNEAEYNAYEANGRKSADKIKTITCFICGKQMKDIEAYRVIGSDKKYCCSEDEYRKYREESELRQKVILLIGSFIGSKKNYAVQNKVFASFFVQYDLKLIYNYLNDNINTITRAMRRIVYEQDAPTYNCYRYLLAVINNNIVQYKMPKTVQEKPVDQNELKEIKFKKRKTRRAFGE